MSIFDAIFGSDEDRKALRNRDYSAPIYNRMDFSRSLAGAAQGAMAGAEKGGLYGALAGAAGGFGQGRDDAMKGGTLDAQRSIQQQAAMGRVNPAAQGLQHQQAGAAYRPNPYAVGGGYQPSPYVMPGQHPGQPGPGGPNPAQTVLGAGAPGAMPGGQPGAPGAAAGPPVPLNSPQDWSKVQVGQYWVMPNGEIKGPRTPDMQ